VKVLLVEDNLDDVELTREGFRRTGRDIDLMHVPDGVQCLHYLRKEGEFADAETPDIVLLDLNMPVMDGREVMTEIRRDEKLKHLPLVVLTTSSSKIDLIISYRLGCNSYIVKPVDFNCFQKIVENLCTYWIDTAVGPPKCF
jgi:two-component system, chemotaxis family, response regulator Rcp1